MTLFPHLSTAEKNIPSKECCQDYGNNAYRADIQTYIHIYFIAFLMLFFLALRLHKLTSYDYYSMIKGKVFIVDVRENSQRPWEEYRVERESSRLSVACRLDVAMREAGAERGSGLGGKERERGIMRK